MKREEIVKDAAWVVEDFLTEEECESFLSRAVAAGIENAPSAGDVRYRNSNTVFIEDEKLAAICFDRILPLVPDKVVVDDDDEQQRCASNDGLRHLLREGSYHGTWTPYALNARWRIARYTSEGPVVGGHFGPHRDAGYRVDEHHRSLITVNGYLTDRPLGTGGATRFVKDDVGIYTDENGSIITTRESDVSHRVESNRAGKAVVFFHDLMHDGEPLKVGSPSKWLFRTEVMYRRDPATAPRLSEDQRTARKYVQEAERAESEGNIPKAMKLYSLAYKLDPSLEDPT